MLNDFIDLDWQICITKILKPSCFKYDVYSKYRGRQQQKGKALLGKARM